MTEGLSLGLQQGCARVNSHQAFQPSGGGAPSKPPFGENPYRFEAFWYIEDSFVSINAAHDLDRTDSDAIAVNGRY